MPIECKFPVKPMSQDEFHAIDKMVMRHAFNIQNELGRLCDEKIYQNELTYRCQQDGLNILTEAMICVTHKTFKKLYYLDMLAENGGIYELKTTTALHQKNATQLINYLLLSDLNHGKLINLRPSSVEHRFVSTQLTTDIRLNFSLDHTHWDEKDEMSELLKKTIDELLTDWGAFLDINLYKEALLYFLGKQALQPIEIRMHGRLIGQQNICLLQPDTALHISSIKRGFPTYMKHIMRLFHHTHLQKIQWINFNQETVQLISLKK